MASILSQLKNLCLYKKSIFEKENIRILITDSGVGGISVANDLYYFFQKNTYYKNVTIMFADCRNGNKGYNSIEDKKKKIQLFSEKMFQLDNILNPDIIFVACNTLSILLTQTNFFRCNQKPIIDICNVSLNLMTNVLNQDNGLFILGTNTTIGQNFYKKNLIEMGYSSKNIVNQLCPNLARHIENSNNFTYYLQQNVKWLANRIKEKKPNHFNKYAISFNCTHYLYAMNYFRKQLHAIDENPLLICPNLEMKNILANYLNVNNFLKTHVQFLVYKNKITKNYQKKILHFSTNKNLIFLI